MALVLITHDPGVVAEAVNRAMVMYAGRIADSGDVEALLDAAAHPYKVALLPSCQCRTRKCATARCLSLKGKARARSTPQSGCPFHPRCAQARDICATKIPRPRHMGEMMARCHFAEDLDFCGYVRHLSNA